MNGDSQNELRERMEIRVVALLLGEASAFETAEIEQALQSDAKLAAFHDQMRRTIGLTREASKQFSAITQTAVEPPKLSPERRAALLAHFQKGKVVATPAVLPKRRRRRWLLPTSLAAGFVVLASVILSLNSRRFYRAGCVFYADACRRQDVVSDLRKMPGARPARLDNDQRHAVHHGGQ